MRVTSLRPARQMTVFLSPWDRGEDSGYLKVPVPHILAASSVQNGAYSTGMDRGRTIVHVAVQGGPSQSRREVSEVLDHIRDWCESNECSVTGIEISHMTLIPTMPAV